VQVEALGYRTVRTTLLVLGDVSGTVEMNPQPVPLPPIAVRPVTFNLRGRITEKGTGLNVAYVSVRIPDVGETTTNDGGYFRLGNLGGGRMLVIIERFGWLPARLEVDLQADTTIALQLERDAITDRIIAQQVGKLSVRVRGTGYPLRTIDRATVRKSGAATRVDINSGLGGVRITNCPGTNISACIDYRYSGVLEPFVYIDDRPIQCGLDVLRVYPNAMIERIDPA
jgi:hypothetical protein